MYRSAAAPKETLWESGAGTISIAEHRSRGDAARDDDPERGLRTARRVPSTLALTGPPMPDSIDEIRSLDDLRAFIHRTLCEKENLLADQYVLTELPLSRRQRQCGLQFTLQGPRSLRLGAIWVADFNTVYFYDARGARYLKFRLRQRLSNTGTEPVAA